MNKSDDVIRKAALLYEKLAEPFVGREEEAKVLVLALLSREHAILIGEPGTGKSALARRLASLINAKFFKYLLTKFTEPGELLGPLDIQALKKGEYRRITRGKLPEAEIAFLDEVFNASSAVLNSLLSVMQERIVYDGFSEIKTNVWSIIGASNTTPEEPELEALYDRFLFRHIVLPLPPERWGELLDSAWKIEMSSYASAEPVISINEILKLNKILFKINIKNIKNKLIRLLMILEEKGIHVTDRRKGKILKAIAAHAILQGRMEARIDDLVVLKYTVPRDPDEFDKINIILFDELKTKDKILRELEEIRANLSGVEADIKRLPPFDPRLIDYYRNLKSVKVKVRSLVSDSDDDEIIEKASELLGVIDDLINNIMIKLNA